MIEDNRTIYKGILNKSTVDNSLIFAKKYQDKFQQKSWDCDLRTSLNITDNILNCRNLLELKQNVLAHIDAFMELRNTYYDGYIDGSWINVYEKNNYQEFHNHISDVVKGFSGVLYLSENNSEIEFGIESRIKFKPELGEIFIFDDTHLHRVLPNKNDNLRISLAFNFRKVNSWNRVIFE